MRDTVLGQNADEGLRKLFNGLYFPVSVNDIDVTIQVS